MEKEFKSTRLIDDYNKSWVNIKRKYPVGSRIFTKTGKNLEIAAHIDGEFGVMFQGFELVDGVPTYYGVNVVDIVAYTG